MCGAYTLITVRSTTGAGDALLTLSTVDEDSTLDRVLAAGH